MLKKVIFVLLPLLSVQSASAQDFDTPEGKAVKAVLQYCLPHATGEENATTRAKKDGLREMDASETPLRADAEHVFVVDPGNTVIMNFDSKLVCSVAVRKANVVELNKLIDYWFGAETPFKPVANKSKDGAVYRTFKGIIARPILLQISTKEKFIEGQMQALFTLNPIEQEEFDSLK